MGREPGITPPNGTSPQTEPTQTTEWAAFTAEAGKASWVRLEQTRGDGRPAWPVARGSRLFFVPESPRGADGITSGVAGPLFTGRLCVPLPSLCAAEDTGNGNVCGSPSTRSSSLGLRISCSPVRPRGVWDGHVSPVGCTQLRARSRRL